MRTIVDSSVWIDFLWKKELPQVKLLRTMLEQDEDIATCGVIVTEVLQGIRDDRQFVTMEAQLRTLSYLDLSLTHFITAAQIYRTLRSQGLTIRKPIDCMIASLWNSKPRFCIMTATLRRLPHNFRYRLEVKPSSPLHF